MNRFLCIALLLAAFCPFAHSQRAKVFLECSALTSSYTYSDLRGDVAGCLTDAGYRLVNAANDANWTIQVYGSVGSQKKSTVGSYTLYSSDVTVSIMIDRGAYAQRVFETNLKVSGKNMADFDEAAVDAYKRLAPQICETILQHISQ